MNFQVSLYIIYCHYSLYIDQIRWSKCKPTTSSWSWQSLHLSSENLDEESARPSLCSFVQWRAMTLVTRPWVVEVVHLGSLDLPLYFHFNTWSAQWRAECKAGPLLCAGLTGEHVCSAAQNRTNLGKPPLPQALLQGQQRLGSRRVGLVSV